jgi:hypothetical protein
MPRQLYPRGVAGTHWIGGWVSLGVALDAVGKKNNFFPAMNRTAAGSLLQYRLSYPLLHIRYTEGSVSLLSRAFFMGI